MRSRRRDKGFTLIELAIVVVIIGVLAALLLPALIAAQRTARNTSVTSEFRTLATSIANFRVKFGDIPPSRIMLSETGVYDVDATGPAGAMIVSANGTGGTDITYAALAQRSMIALRKFWPRLALTSAPGATAAPGITATNFYDFNGDGVRQTIPYILNGPEALVFCLGGVPLNTGTNADPKWSMSGWGKVPTNPFSNNDEDGNPMFNPNRDAPLHEFDNGRLRDPDADAATDPVRFPAFFDRLGTDVPIAYFSSYGGEAYDPNDCNVAEMDDAGAGPILRHFRVRSPVVDDGGTAGRVAISAPPNPMSSSTPNAPTVQWAKGQSFQLISAGRDGYFGPGGQFVEGATETLPANPPGEVSPAGVDRSREFDNLASFASGPLR